VIWARSSLFRRGGVCSRVYILTGLWVSVEGEDGLLLWESHAAVASLRKRCAIFRFLCPGRGGRR
jgi:hypothetical protein